MNEDGSFPRSKRIRPIHSLPFAFVEQWLQGSPIHSPDLSDAKCSNPDARLLDALTHVTASMVLVFEAHNSEVLLPPVWTMSHRESHLESRFSRKIPRCYISFIHFTLFSHKLLWSKTWNENRRMRMKMRWIILARDWEDWNRCCSSCSENM